MFHNLRAQDLYFSLFIDVFVRVENPAILDSDGALDLAFAQHYVRQFEFLILRHIICQEILEESLGALCFFFFELSQVFFPHLEEWSKLVINALLLLCSKLFSDGLKLNFAKLEPGFTTAIFWAQSKLKAHCV